MTCQEQFVTASFERIIHPSSHLLYCGQLFLELKTLPLIDRIGAKKDHPYQQKCDGDW